MPATCSAFPLLFCVNRLTILGKEYQIAYEAQKVRVWKIYIGLLIAILLLSLIIVSLFSWYEMCYQHEVHHIKLCQRINVHSIRLHEGTEEGNRATCRGEPQFEFRADRLTGC
jgi:hypothetical protein